MRHVLDKKEKRGYHQGMDNTTTLKPCPFCGGENPELRMTASGENWHIVCDECGGQSGVCGTSAPVVERWNTRPDEGALLHALECARRALRQYGQFFKGMGKGYPAGIDAELNAAGVLRSYKAS